MIAFSRLYVTGQWECLLHCERGCSVDGTVGAADCCGMSGDERARECFSLSRHVMFVQVCTEGSVSSLPVTLCYRYMFL
jgi:hypothetical protein